MENKHSPIEGIPTQRGPNGFQYVVPVGTRALSRVGVTWIVYEIRTYKGNLLYLCNRADRSFQTSWNMDVNGYWVRIELPESKLDREIEEAFI